MSQLGAVTDRILDAVHAAPGCQLDDLVVNLPELTWNQVFSEVDRLSRTGQVRITTMGDGTYAIRLPNTATRTRTPTHISSGGSSSVQGRTAAVPLATPVASGRPWSCGLEERAMSRGATESDVVKGCPRCHNWMVEETFVDRETSPSVSSFTGWRCLICGEILDPIILQNRTLRPEPQYGRARTKVAKW
jgi:hypothetical protein